MRSEKLIEIFSRTAPLLRIMSTSRDSYRIYRVSMTASPVRSSLNEYCIPAGDMQIKSFASCWSFFMFGAPKGISHSDLTISRLSGICAQYLHCNYIAECQAKAPWHNARTVFRQSSIAYEESRLTDASQGTEHQAQKCRRKPHYYILGRVAPGGLVVQEPGLPSVLEKIQSPTR